MVSRTAMVILAAGFGTRLKPLTERIPKPLLPFFGKSLLARQIEFYNRVGFETFFVNTHHLYQSVEAEIERLGKELNVEIIISREEGYIRGTGGALREMRKKTEWKSCFEKQKLDFLVANVDIITQAGIDALITNHEKNNAVATMLIKSEEQDPQKKQIEINSQNKITRLLTVKSDEYISGAHKNYFYTGIQVLSSRLLDYLPEEEEHKAPCIIRDGYFRAMLKEPVFAEIYDGFFSDVGLPEDYISAYFAFMKNEIPTWNKSPLPDNRDGIFVAERAELDEGVTLTAPVVIESGSVVKRGAALGPNVIVADGTKINEGESFENAFVMNDVVLK